MKVLSVDKNFFSEIDPLKVVEGVTLLHLSGGVNSIPEPCVVCADNLESSEVVDTMMNLKIKHLVQKNRSYFQSDVVSAAQLAKNPELYFKKNVEALLPENGESICISFSEPMDKEKLMTDSMAFISRFSNQGGQEACRVILEELYMNAIIDAPREAVKLSSQSDLIRATKTASKMWIKSGENRIAIACEDPFGSLSIPKFLLRMKEIYLRSAGEVINLDRDQGGAGLGCVLMFENSSSIFLGVKVGVMSLVSCLVPSRMSHRQRSELKKGMHLFQGSQHG